jgi:hypothetical protein
MGVHKTSKPSKLSLWFVILLFGSLLLFAYLNFFWVFFADGLKLITSLLGDSGAGRVWNTLGMTGQMVSSLVFLAIGLSTFVIGWRHLENRVWSKRLLGERLLYSQALFVDHFSKIGIEKEVADIIYRCLATLVPIKDFPIMPSDHISWYMSDPEGGRMSGGRATEGFLAFLFTETDLAKKEIQIPQAKQLHAVRTIQDVVILASKLHKGAA